MQGTELTLHERESNLCVEFDNLPLRLGELLHSYYWRYAKLINDMNITGMSMQKIQINTKFVNHLQLEWSPFVTATKQAKDLHNVNFDQLVKDVEWFKENMLLAQAQEAGLHTTLNFKADHVDSYDLDCDDDATSCAIFMASLSPTRSINEDTAGPSYDSELLFETEYNEHFVSNNDPCAESYEYVFIYVCLILVTIENDVAEYVPPLEQNKDDMVLSVIEQIKVQVEQCYIVEDENVSLAFKVSFIVKEREHIKLEYKKLYDSIKLTQAQNKLTTDSLQQKLTNQIFENAMLRAQLQANISEPKMNQNGTSVNTKFEKPSTSGNKLYVVAPFPKTQFIPKVVEKNNLSKIVTSHLNTNKVIEKCTKVFTLGLLRIESEPINAYFKNIRVVHQDYLRVTRVLRNTAGIELLVYVSASCPFTESGYETWIVATSRKKNNKPYAVTSKIGKTVDRTSYQFVAKQNIQKTNHTLLPSTGRVSYTNASGSHLKNKPKTDRIQQTSSRSIKNKVEVQHRKSKTPQQNGVVERQNRTLVKAARTMLIFSKSPKFLGAEAVATSCYTQNRSPIHTRYNKTPYELLRNRKPDLKFLYVFGPLCYPTNDSEDLGKLKPKADIGPELQPSTSRKINSELVPKQGVLTSTKPPSKKDLDLLFQPMFDEYFKPPPSAVSPIISAATLPISDTTGASSSTTID
ncbi:retrovirus-related pol polyprotein from transposon TNT 1-94 [Tanacetum coccineum]